MFVADDEPGISLFWGSKYVGRLLLCGLPCKSIRDHSYLLRAVRRISERPTFSAIAHRRRPAIDGLNRLGDSRTRRGLAANPVRFDFAR